MNRKQELEILGRKRNTIEFKILANLQNADMWYNKGEKEKAIQLYKDAVKLWKENPKEVHNHFLKCIIHLEKKYIPKKTYREYKYEGKILARQEKEGLYDL